MEAMQQLLSHSPKTMDPKYGLIPTSKGHLMTYENRVIIPEDQELRRKIMQRYHDHPSAGHPGEQGTYYLAKSEVYWPGMATFVRNYVKGCAACQQYKINRNPSHPPLQPIGPPTST